ncbi:hypothetical protein HYC85_021712 [Camellia sinensis]|uniref:Uncharacterized protein n=1 Tax=Camellia sinensis TaxID=4442 RepID=A0A7J7GJY2_CAMSI|nr:hypothetical protein HYC85_021712 [Camellia sinensis]
MQTKRAGNKVKMFSFGPPMKEILAPVDLLLQLEDSVKQGLGSRRATRNINVNWDNPVTTTNNRVRVMVISTTICTASHRDDPPWLGHLIIDPAIILAESGGHLIGESASDDHTIGLPRARPEDNAEAIQVVASSSGVHHFHGAASEAEGHGPDGAAACPVHQIVHLRDHKLRRLRHPRRRRRRRRRRRGVGRGMRRLSRQRRQGSVDRRSPL